jgi:ketosteroid isomerase-like protein
MSVFFDLAPPLKHVGFNQKWVQDWFDGWESGVGFAPTDVKIDASGDLAVVRSIDHMTGRKKGGETVDLWSRSTVCFHKEAGMWKVFHVHSSVPFYMDGSFRAAIDLKPE